ncbi:MAG: alpha/beta hydrolase [Bacteroidales bacterium]|nr:alpha/beta hydrolase [Bacteroidales bacterium]
MINIPAFYAQSIVTHMKIKVYLIPGQGADYRLFDNLKIDGCYEVVKISWIVPEKKMKMRDFALKIAEQIDTSSRYSLIGVSLGGMICSELTDEFLPEKVIIISSAKCRNELPGRYRFMSKVPINKLVPARLYKWGSYIAQPLFEPDRKNGKETFKAMLKAKDPQFLKRTADMITNWEKRTYNSDIIHIHGDNDYTIPVKNVDADYVIKDGSHMMVYTRGEELSRLINQLLK